MTTIIAPSFPSTIFRAYDIRGIVGETLTPDSVFAIGQAVGSEALSQGETALITGRDGRLSGPLLLTALQSGILASGCDVIDIGAVPTPVLYFATHTLATRSGVMLTGSHNPSDYNGLKIVLAGQALSGEQLQGLYQRIVKGQLAQGRGTLKQFNVIDDYITKIKTTVRLARPLKIVVDAGNGIAGKIAPLLFKTLGCEVVELYCDVDGHFPNHHPDPSQPENLQDLMTAVQETRADIGLAFDGDGDRLGVVTEIGEIIWPDRQLMLFASDILQRQPESTIIFDVKCTRHLTPWIKQRGGKPLMWKTGHSLIKAKLRETQAPLAGEMSGHIFFQERWFGFDDGLYAAARLLEILSRESRTANEIFCDIPDSYNTPELKIPLSEERKFQFMQQFIEQAVFPQGKVTTIDGLRVDFPFGFGLIRPSNTTPCLVLRFEADSPHDLLHIQSLFCERLLTLDPDLTLPSDMKKLLCHASQGAKRRAVASRNA
jgi:phosphomannomutase/phosphoglucomutase